jgi:predicted nucleotidyltransferase
MAKAPKNPEEIFEEITVDFKNIFQRDLISIILYGSGASGHYIPGKSDLNFLVILSEGGIDNLDKAISTVIRWRKRQAAIPLFMTKAEIVSSLDSYPIEFLTMKKHYKLVYGEDVLGGLSFELSHLRLQFERELRGKILHLRRGLLETEGTAKRLRELIKASFTAFISLFKALLYLKGFDIPQSRRDIIRTVGDAYSIDPNIFLKCADIKEDVDSIPASEVKNLFMSYLKEIEKLSKFVDTMTL